VAALGRPRSRKKRALRGRKRMRTDQMGLQGPEKLAAPSQ
jgi:hypothetical protein